MDHLAYYDLKEEPFSIVPLTNFYYHNEQHDQAFMRLRRSVEGMKGLAVLVGDVGTGKTLLARRLLESLPEEQYEAALLVVLHSTVTGSWLIKRVAQQMGVADTESDKAELIGRLYERLNEISEEGRRAVVLIDEAHMLRSPETLEEVRGLLNLELADSKLLSIVMFGMPELDQRLSSEPALKQRMAVRFPLKNFTPDVLADYVRFRTFHAGSNRQIFSGGAIEAIFDFTRGNPRLVNVVSDNALFEGYVRRAGLPLGREIVQGVAADLGLPPLDPTDEPAERR
ncbi:MAG: AAA family ATPase [Proteobacteria bacterium]|nr:AAA family ATPase [Pseudomonadota bacterium]